MSMSFEQVKFKLEGQLVWLGLLAPGTPAHRQAWQLIEQLWAKLLAITRRSEEIRAGHAPIFADAHQMRINAHKPHQ